MWPIVQEGEQENNSMDCTEARFQSVQEPYSQSNLHKLWDFYETLMLKYTNYVANKCHTFDAGFNLATRINIRLLKKLFNSNIIV